MTNFLFSNVARLVFVFVLVFLHSHAAIAHASMLTVGDEIDGVTLAKGAADARPLRVFCAAEVHQNVTTADCKVPQLSTLAIGDVFLGTDNAFREYEWSDLHWELYLDDQYVNLAEFGTYDYVLPTIAPHPSLVREVFMKFTAWDIVLTNLQPGVHTIEGRAFAHEEEYRWVIDLQILDQSLSEWAVYRQGEKSGGIHFRPSQRENGLSPFHHSDRFYG